jgi:hypothetical protein
VKTEALWGYMLSMDSMGDLSLVPKTVVFGTSDGVANDIICSVDKIYLTSISEQIEFYLEDI